MDRGRPPAAPQPRPRPLGSHNLPAQPVDPTAGQRNGHTNGHGPGNDSGKEQPPGLWLEAFTNAVNGVPQEPKTDEDSDDAWDKET